MKTIDRQAQGVTLLELLAVMTIVALLAGGGLRAWTGYQQALRLEQGAQQLLAFLNRVQANAYWHNETRTVRLVRQGEYWCMESATDSGGDAAEGFAERGCSAGGGCCDDGGRRFTRISKALAVTRSTSDAFAFYGLRNAAQPGHITLSNPAGEVRLVISVRGRMRLCSETRQVLAIPLC
ncbi:prepilin peptidase-dependent protein [Brenneria populi]|uniref:Prepilin peptidase-dependent protein n=1 Tax=Brenneria populi TaxID=1505588 RepID=A0ABU6JTW6_9GAMM|nr:prepilin peptidase-dependent protein [Brenneria populi Li et al. 2015]